MKPLWLPFPVLVLAFASAARAGYDPLDVPASDAVGQTAFTVPDPDRGREIPILAYLPTTEEPAVPLPVVLFSHGLGGNREGCAYLGRHWAARGYAAVFLQHPGSDDSVWKGLPLADRVGAMQQAASMRNLRTTTPSPTGPTWARNRPGTRIITASSWP